MFKNKCPATQSNETAECAKDVNRPSLVLLVSRFVGAHPGNIRDSLKLLPPAPDITLAHIEFMQSRNAGTYPHDFVLAAKEEADRVSEM